VPPLEKHADTAGSVDVVEHVAADAVADQRGCQGRVDSGDPHRFGAGDDPVDRIVVDGPQVDRGRVGSHRDASSHSVVQGVVLDSPDQHRARVRRVDRDRVDAGAGHRVVENRGDRDRAGAQRSAVSGNLQLAARVVGQDRVARGVQDHGVVQVRFGQTGGDDSTTEVQTTVSVDVFADFEEAVAVEIFGRQGPEHDSRTGAAQRHPVAGVEAAVAAVEEPVAVGVDLGPIPERQVVGDRVAG